MTYRILIVGLGSIGLRHLKLARKNFPEADIRVFRHKKTDVIPEYSNGTLYEISEIKKFMPSIAVLCNPAPFHIDFAEILTELNTNLLIEKPISDSVAKVENFIKVVEVKKTVVLVGYNLRFSESLNKFRDLILAGDIGTIFSVRCEVGQYLPSWRADKDYRQSVSANSLLGGGVLLELSHEIDYLLWIFDKVNQVSGWVGNRSDLEINVEDSAHLFFEFKSGVVANVNMDFIRRDKTRKCTVIGSQGTLVWDGIQNKVTKFSEDGIPSCVFESIKVSNDDTYEREWLDFIEKIDSQSTALDSIKSSLDVLRIVEDIKKNAKEHN